MKKLLSAGAVCAALSVGGASAADRNCYSAADVEAEQAILFETDLMVVSSSCRDNVYGEFRLRNKNAMLHYQNAMINHFRRVGARNPKSAFDAWQTGLANEAARKQAVIPTVQVCQQAANLLTLARSLDAKGLHDYAVAHTVNDTHPKCKR
ncbi:MAG: hypothetical protein J2P48_11915 [Alphaproteobacteria bacterium]|nr:hypothetical protein [Alphaproteobacteria bacterium]